MDMMDDALLRFIEADIERAALLTMAAQAMRRRALHNLDVLEYRRSLPISPQAAQKVLTARTKR